MSVREADSSALQPVFGAFGEFGGRFVAELLWPALEELSSRGREIVASASFQQDLDAALRQALDGHRWYCQRGAL